MIEYIYIFLYIYLFAFAILSRKYSRVFLFFFFLLAFIISSFRGVNVGIDTKQFVWAYEKINNKEIMYSLIFLRYEPGFIILCKILGVFSSNAQLLIAFTSFVFLLSSSIFIYRYSKFKFLSCFLFLSLNIYFSSMNLMRQYLAISFLLFSIDYLYRNKIFKYLIFVFIASMFHYSAFVFIIFYLPFLRNGITKKKETVILGIYIFVMVFSPVIIPSLFKILGFLKLYSGYQYSRYSKSNYFGMLVNVFVFVFIYIFSIKRNKKTKPDIYEYFKLLFLLSIVCYVFGTSMTIFSRMAHFFTIYVLVVVPYNIKELFRDYLMGVRIVLIIGISIIYFLLVAIFRPYWQGVLPYEIFIK